MAHTVTTSTQALIYNPANQAVPTSVTIRGVSGGVHYVGQSGVTTSSGVPIGPGDVVTLHSPPVALYAINGASGTLDVSIGRG